MADKGYPGMLQRHLATTVSVGEWEGQEELAATSVNRIYQALYDAVQDDMAEEAYFHDVCNQVWNDWGSDEKLLTVTDEQIREYVARFFPH